MARSAGKSALRQPEALFSFTRPICRVGSSVVEQRPFKPLVVGSNPTRPTTRADSQLPIPNRAARRPDSTIPLALDERSFAAQKGLCKIFLPPEQYCSSAWPSASTPRNARSRSRFLLAITTAAIPSLGSRCPPAGAADDAKRPRARCQTEALNVCRNTAVAVRYRRNSHDHYVIPPRDAPGGIGWRGAEKMRISV